MADATVAWNNNNAAWEFPRAPLADSRATFADAWGMQPHTMDFTTAIAGITAAVNQALGSSSPEPGLDDLYNASIQNW